MSEDFSSHTRALIQQHGGLLLSLARASIESGLAGNGALHPAMQTLPAELDENGACFVTLKTDSQLRGCIGSPEAWRPLVIDVCENAFRSAFADPRFSPLSAGETGAGLDVSISLLSPASPIDFDDEDDLVAKLKPGVDGLIIADGPRRALFLPQVWEQLPNANEFLAHLEIKAGISSPSPAFQAWRFIALEVKSPWDKIKPVNP